MTKIDIPFIRQQFPALSGKWCLFDNAGGSQVANKYLKD